MKPAPQLIYFYFILFFSWSLLTRILWETVKYQVFLEVLFYELVGFRNWIAGLAKFGSVALTLWNNQWPIILVATFEWSHAK